MEHSTAANEPLYAWIQLFRLVFVLVIPTVLALVAHYRASWLVRAWAATWLLLVAGVVAIDPGVADARSIPGFLLAGVPSGLAALWLHLTRRHRVLSRLAAQFASAVLVQVCAIALLAIGLRLADSLRRAGGY
jgi:hypothetical protein